MNVDKKRLYNILTNILNPHVFEFNHDKEQISVKIPIKPEHIKHFEAGVKAILHDPSLPTHLHGPDLQRDKFRIDSKLINIDGKTIKIDKMGQFYVNYEDIAFQVENILLQDEHFFNRIEDMLLEKSSIQRLLKKLQQKEAAAKEEKQEHIPEEEKQEPLEDIIIDIIDD